MREAAAYSCTAKSFRERRQKELQRNNRAFQLLAFTEPPFTLFPAFLQHRGKMGFLQGCVHGSGEGGCGCSPSSTRGKGAEAWGPKKGTQSDADTCQLKGARAA